MKTYLAINVFMHILRREGNRRQSIDGVLGNEGIADNFATAVSLHSHTLHSKEGLDFIPRALGKVGPARAALHALEERHRRKTGQEVPYDRVYWRPPLHPNAAYELESRQIRETLHLHPLVSITDHDNIEACAELRTLGIDVPHSVEWTVPYDSTVFHIGVHNLPADEALPLFREMERVTANPSPERLAQMLELLDSLRDVLLVLNHPLSNEFKTGFRTHARLLQRFFREHGREIHALESNGLQPARNNQRVAEMARELGLPVISGGDRHCLEPNAIVNLTNAATFGEFVDEIRRGRASRVLFLPHYREAIACRYVEFVSQAVRTYREFTGRQRWVDRVFKQTDEGDVPLSIFWPHGGPRAIRAFVSTVGVLASPQMRPTLRLALRAQSEVRA
jgi:hypothetical protein